MNLKLLQSLLDDFQADLLRQSELENHFHWECLLNFQENWNLEADDFADMYDRSLESSISRQLWKREQFFPKEMMLKFIKLQAEFVREGFRDLFKEEKSVEGRMGRFLFYCDQLLEEYKRENPLTVENNHYHDDYHIIALYLCFHQPADYCLYEPEGFRLFLKLVKAPNPPQTHDLERYFKVCRTLGRFLDQRGEIRDWFFRQLNGKIYYPGQTLLPVFEFFNYLAKR